jgi:hypothetical protein
MLQKTQRISGRWPNGNSDVRHLYKLIQIYYDILSYSKYSNCKHLQTMNETVRSVRDCESLGAEACKSWKQSLRLCRRHSWLDGQAGAHTVHTVLCLCFAELCKNCQWYIMIISDLWLRFHLVAPIVCSCLFNSCFQSSPKCCFYTCIVVQLCSIGWSISFSLRTTFEHDWRLSNWIQSFATLSAAQASSCKKNIVMYLNAPATW